MIMTTIYSFLSILMLAIVVIVMLVTFSHISS